MIPISKRVTGIVESKSIGQAAIVEQLRKEGKKIISMNVGEPDLKVPKEVIEATQKALSEHQTRYSLVEGLAEVREAIAQKLKKENGIDAGPANILLANGSKHILYIIYQTLCDEGDEVIIPSPYWVSFPEAVKLAGGVPVFVPTVKDQLNVSAIAKAITPRTKAILINSPNNPTGAVYPLKTLQELAELAVKKNITVISDEAYERLVYSGLKNVSIASLGPEIAKRTITVQSFSKGFCMTGFRIGYLAADTHFVSEAKKFQGHLSGNNCTFAQYGALAALLKCQYHIDEMLKVMERRRDLAYRLCKEIFPCEKPEGAFYLFPNIADRLKRGQFKSSDEMCNHILEKANVSILPGSAFGAPEYLRISYATSDENIVEAFKRMKEVL